MEEEPLFGELDRMNDDEDEQGNRDDEAIEVPAPGETKSEAIKPKRIIRKPQPKLDDIRLMGPRGICMLRSTFKDVKFKGKGNEKDDLNLLMKKYEHWAHRLFAKLRFDDTIKQLEKLGTKKSVKVMMKRIRLDMLQSDELGEITEEADDVDVIEKSNEPDVFDQLIGTNYSDSFNEISEFRQSEMFSQDISQRNIWSSQSNTTTTLTSDQKERIERNKRLAAERRQLNKLKETSLAITDDDLLDSELTTTDENGINSSQMDVSKPLPTNSINETEGIHNDESNSKSTESTVVTSSKEERPKEVPSNLCTEDDIVNMMEVQ